VSITPANKLLNPVSVDVAFIQLTLEIGETVGILYSVAELTDYPLM
jgi:hypothetical protein